MDTCYVDGCIASVEKYLGKLKIPYCKPHYETVKDVLKKSTKLSDKLKVTFSGTKTKPELEIAVSQITVSTLRLFKKTEKISRG